MDPSNVETSAPRVFVSHSTKDSSVARLIAEALEEQGFPCWIAPRDVPPGGRYGEAVIDGINASAVLLLLLTDHSNSSQQVLAEVERAVSKGLRVLSIRLEPVTLTKSLEYFLSSFQWLDAFSTPFDPHLGQIVAAVRQIEGSRKEGRSPDAPSGPLPGSLGNGKIRLALPSGMHHVPGARTFLFTDIEGSTKLWESHTQAMDVALAQHDALMRAIIASCNGEVFKTIGDAFCAVFPLAGDALSAALAAQQRLPELENALPGGLRVRIAVHTGVASHRDGDYFGPCLNMVARLRDAGHGGQTLVSEAVAHLVPQLPEEVALRDLGTHRLRDLAQPQRLFQLTHPELPGDFPPLRTLAPTIHNLPLQLSSFIGREQILKDLGGVMRTARLVTVVGVAGTGKSRLAIEAGSQAAMHYGDGVYYVGLAPLTDGSLIPQAVATALGLREDPRIPVMQMLVDTLRSRHVLLMLDNCEHLIEGVVRLCETLLQSCSKLTVIATSQEPLGIAGEVTCAVPPLTLPVRSDRQTQNDWVRAVSESEAVLLFAARAQAALPTFVLSPSNADAVAKVCRRLDGIPLAIELAAARVKVLPVDQIDVRLDNRFRLLTGGSRTALPKHQTLQAALDWSYDLLTEQERQMLHSVSVFQGGWTLDAAETVCESKTLPPWDILELLGRLVDKSLAQFRDDEHGGRYGLLETLLAYGRERLRETSEGDGLHERHLRFFTDYAERIARDLFGPRHVAALNRLEAEHDNLRAALDWCAFQPGRAGDGLRLGAALWPFWAGRGHIVEGRRRLAELLKGDTTPSPARADALIGAASLARLQGDLKMAEAQYEESLEISRNAGYEDGVAWATGGLGGVARSRGQVGIARDRLSQSLALHRSHGNRRGEALTLNGLGMLDLRQGQYSDAQIRFQQALALFRSLEDPQGMAQTLNNLGIVSHTQGDLAGAQASYHESQALQEELGDRRGTADTLHNLGVLALALGDADEAKRLQEESLSRSREVGDSRAVAAAINSLADVALDQGDFRLASGLYRDCLRAYLNVDQQDCVAYALEGLAFVAGHHADWERVAQLIGASVSLRLATATPLSSSDAQRVASLASEARTALEEGYENFHEQGMRWTPDEAAQYALSG